MIIRGVDQSGDWTFGSGIQNYLFNQNAIGLNIKTRLQCFLNDCFFDMGFGIDYFNLLGTKNEAALIWSIRSIILDSEGVNSIVDVSLEKDENRNLFLSYEVTTIYGLTVAADLLFPVTPFSGISKFTADIVWAGQAYIDVVVSSSISDARLAIWQIYDELDSFSEVVGVVQPLSQTTVRITITPSPTGIFRLVGIA